MTFATWALLIGGLLIAMALSGTLLKRLPLSTAMLYLAAGFCLGPAGWAVLTPHPILHAALLERVTEVAVLIVLVAGAMLPFPHLPANSIALIALLFLAIRPASVWLGLLGAPVSREQRTMIAWFGIRGIGSVYYLMYSIHHGLPLSMAEQITAITLATVTVSILLHGISVRPMMRLYRKRQAQQGQ